MSGETVALLVVALHAAIVLVAAVWISARRAPSAAIAWILAIAFVPLLGIAWFLLVGAGRLPRARREKQQEVNRAMLERTPGVWETGHRDEWPEALSSAAALNRELGALPMVGGTTAALEGDYAETFRRMIADIDAAERAVNVEFYILVLDDTTRPFVEALGRASARGVSVRVLSDHLSGFLYPHRRATQAALADAGAEWRAMLPLRPFRGQWQRADLRNHRKLLTIDGRVGWTGSLNLIDESYLKPSNIRRGLHWKELMVRLEGPVVRELDAVFATDWYSETDELLPLDETPVEVPSPAASELLDAQVVPSGPSFENDNNLKLFVYLLQNARRRVSITSPYFVPDESTQLAIVTAASRGVAVELFVSEIGDQALVHHAQRSYYEALLAAGVRIHLYRAPTVLHAKHFSIDDDVAVIGSSNMDIRSFSLNMEVSLLVHGRGFVDALREVEDSYRAASRELTLDEWRGRPMRARVGDALARLTSSLQ
ncbi:cardiolipin synthase [Homoserinibacter sp. GY 40078]|uniref:cardiolipin synthase n=1 Tax=Homoserinibacter sp. GY 40078 TaxID=2603275 RepID=UPI0011C95EAD|nr:cardiolipin synthase [Homoserinibacter sp. GY 40078]TXK19823.1 cardiolipin synthase [Homoserinibacter sp. GY 40078]